MGDTSDYELRAYRKYMYFKNGCKFLRKFRFILSLSENKEQDFAIGLVKF